MKILYGVTKSNFGGAQRYVFDLAIEMKRQGHDVAVLCGQEGKLVEKLRAEKIRVIILNNLERDIVFLKEVKNFVSILKILQKEAPDVFHVNSSKMGGLGALAGRIMRVRKTVFTAHGWAFNEPRPLWQKILIKFFTWITIISAHKTICVSKRTLGQMTGWPFVKNKSVVIRNGLREFALSPKTPRETLTVGTIGELHRIKGHDTLLTAWSKFIKNHKAKLIIIGEGEERENLEKQIEELKISHSVTLKGFLENARSHLLDFDIFVFPSRSEGLPYALLEAGLAGLPVISTYTGGIPEIIETGINGVLVFPDDSESLLSSLILLAENPDIRERLGRNLKETIHKDFLIQKMVHDTLKVYE